MAKTNENDVTTISKLGFKRPNGMEILKQKERAKKFRLKG